MASPDLDRARRLFAAQRYGQVADRCREILSGDPACAEAEHLLGRALTEGGHAPIASLILQHVTATGGADPEVLASLGRAQRLAGDAEAARATLEQAVRDDDALRARLELVELLAEAGQLDAAEAHARRALARHPGEATAHLALADVLALAGRLDDARASFAHAVRLSGGASRHHVTQAIAHQSRGDAVRARRSLEIGARLAPGDPELRHLLAAAGAGGQAERASDEYLVHYFDRFASAFDEQLSELRYQAPERLVEAMAPLLHAPSDILDAGCGTGRCGPLLRPLARRLDGVDISPGMLERAGALGVYDELHARELTAFLLERDGAYDAVVATDVLIYFGAIDELVGLMARALRPAGVLGLSIERSDVPGHAMLPSGRWAHHPETLRSAGRQAGVEFAMQDIELRLEYGRPVAGLIAVGTLG